MPFTIDVRFWGERPLEPRVGSIIRGYQYARCEGRQRAVPEDEQRAN